MNSAGVRRNGIPPGSTKKRSLVRDVDASSTRTGWGQNQTTWSEGPCTRTIFDSDFLSLVYDIW